jgi:hypothetical protein
LVRAQPLRHRTGAFARRNRLGADAHGRARHGRALDTVARSPLPEAARRHYQELLRERAATLN